MASLIDMVVDQTFKRHPYMFLFVLVCCGAVVGYSYQVFAQEIAVQRKFVDIDKRLSRLEVTVDERFLEQRLQSLESDIYDVEQRITDGVGNAATHERLRDLRIRHGATVRELQNLDE